MILKYYFLIALIIVIAAYSLVKKSDWESGSLNLFENKFLYSLVTFLALTVGAFYNRDYQLFCNPVKWTYWFLVPTFTYVTVLPFLLDYKWLKPISSLLHGLSIFVFSYILLFAGLQYLLMLILVSIIGIPLYNYSRSIKEKRNSNFYDWINFYSYVFFAPLYLYTLLLRNLKKAYWPIAAMPFLFCLFFSYHTSTVMVEIEKTIVKSNDKETALLKFQKTSLESHLLELALGLHWKYHTKLVVVDGWRPPYHDPLVGIRMMMIKRPIFYLNEQRLKKLYQKIYPLAPVEFDCKCAKNQVWIN